jgi:hypothetical protein
VSVPRLPRNDPGEAANVAATQGERKPRNEKLHGSEEFTVKRFILTVALASAVLAGGVVHAQPPAFLPGVPGTPAMAPPAADPGAVFREPKLKESFPRLGTNFKVLAPASPNYNAYSYVLGVTDRWLVPEAGTPERPLAGIEKFLAQGGYMPAAFDLRVEPGKQKVVVFATVTADGSIKDVTAAAIQQADGTWACKVGGLPLIQVSSPEALRGPTYGLAVAVFARTR